MVRLLKTEKTGKDARKVTVSGGREVENAAPHSEPCQHLKHFEITHILKHYGHSAKDQQNSPVKSRQIILILK